MSININNIYCSQWLINKELKDFCDENKNEKFYLNPHDILHIEDTINYIVDKKGEGVISERHQADYKAPEKNDEKTENISDFSNLDFDEL